MSKKNVFGRSQEEVEELVEQYFAECEENSRKPTAAGLCIWLGITVKRFVGIIGGKETGCVDDGANKGCARRVMSGRMSFRNMDFSSFSFGTGKTPSLRRLKLRVKDFTYYKLSFNSIAGYTATILGAEIRVRCLGNVR